MKPRTDIMTIISLTMALSLAILLMPRRSPRSPGLGVRVRGVSPVMSRVNRWREGG